MTPEYLDFAWKLVNTGGTFAVLVALLIFRWLDKKEQHENGRACGYNAELDRALWEGLTNTLDKLAVSIDRQSTTNQSLFSELKIIQSQNQALQTSLSLFNSAFAHMYRRDE